MPNKQHTYLVIGANGFVGSYLVESLSNLSGVKVICFDRFSRPPVFRRRPNIELAKGDFFQDGDLESALENVDTVVHCFSASTPASYAADPAMDARTVERNAEIFANCAKVNIKKIAYISSADVYGPASETKFVTEDDKPEPTSTYGKAKLESEYLLESSGVGFGFEHVVFRLTNPYGPRQRFKNGQGVIPKFIDDIKAGRKISVYGDGTASRDYIYIEDAVKMIVDVLIKPGHHHLYNIGSNKQTTINELIEILKERINSKVNIKHKESPATSPNHIRVSTERFSSEFGPPTLLSLPAGIDKVLGYGAL